MATTTLTTAQLTGRVETLEKTVSQHDEFIDGNGKPGAKERIGKLETNYADIKKTLDQMTSRITGLIYTIVGAIIIYVFTSVLPGIIGHIGTP